MFGRHTFVAVISGLLVAGFSSVQADPLSVTPPKIRQAPVPDQVMSQNASRAAMLNQQALAAATMGTYDPLGKGPFSNGATVDVNNIAAQTWESQQSRRLKSAYSNRRLYVFRQPKPLPAPKRTGTLGKPGPFSRRVLASAPPAAEGPPGMQGIYDGAHSEPEPEFRNFKRALDPSQGGESHINLQDILLH